MFKLVRFEPEHVYPLLRQPMNASINHWLTDGEPERLAERSAAFTGMINNEPMICFGVVTLWGRRGYLWSVFSENVRAHSLSVYRNMRKALQVQPWDRLEMDVPLDLEIAHRRAEWLGFKLEVARARKYTHDGEDASIYVWVRE